MKPKLIKFLWSYLRDYKKRLCLVFSALFIVSSTLMAVGRLINVLIDAITNNAEFDGYFLLLLGTLFIFCAASFVRSYNINYIASNVVIAIKKEIFKGLLLQPPYIIERYSASELTFRFADDMEKIHTLITNVFSFIVRNSIMFIGSVVLMFVQTIQLSLIVFCGIALILAVVNKLSRITKTTAAKMQANNAQLANEFLENFLNFKIITAFALAASHINHYHSGSSAYLALMIQRFKLRSVFFATVIFSVSALILLVCYLGSRNIESGVISAGTMVAFIFFASIAAFSLGGIIEAALELLPLLSSVERVYELKRLIEDTPILHTANVKVEPTSTIEFKNIVFAYPTLLSKIILRDINLSFKADGFYGIVGPSGCGKTSLVQLLMQFYQPSAGHIKIDDTTLGRNDNRLFIPNFAYCAQDPMLFSTSLEKNICFGQPYEAQRFKAVIEMTGLSEIIATLPKGLQSEVKQSGANFSGGQKQRISLARALYKCDTKILILDEATSNLDLESEKRIMDNILACGWYHCIICITHRTASIAAAKQIIVMQGGVIADIGTHAELLARSQLYQFLSFTDFVV